jgi:hypothetical protein
MALTDAHNKAPEPEVVLSDGTTHNLREFWIEKTLLLVFLRHFG